MTDEDYKLWCLIKHDDDPFCVRVPSFGTVDYLKELIVQGRRMNNVFQGVDSRQLILQKASHIMTAKDGS